MVRANRSPRAKLERGDYFVLDTRRNFATETFVDLEDLGRKVDALQPWETME
jgi:hypothetical protein